MVRHLAFRKLLTLLPVAACALMAQPVAAQEGAMRIVTTPGADYFGNDYDIVKGTDLDGCTAACFSDQRCKAFTLNETNGWCFLKEGVGELRAVSGATAGRLIETAAVDDSSIEAHRADLAPFVPRATLDDAKRLRLAIAEEARDAGRSGLSVDLLADRASSSLTYPDAIADWREVLRREPTNARAWQGLAEAALAYQPEEYSEQLENARLRLQAAVNAYLVAETEDGRMDALRTLGDGYAADEDWKRAIKTYRAGVEIADRSDLRTKLDDAVASHGFRIVEHTVDNNAANPRICLVFSDPLAAGFTASETVGDYVKVEEADTLPVTASGNQICVDGVEHGRRYRILARSGIPSADGERLERQADLDIYVRDRDPMVRFSTNAYVLPAGGDPSIPVVTINTDEIEARLQRVGDRALTRVIGDGQFLRQLNEWQIDEMAEATGTDVWTGTVSVAREANAEVTTAIPVAAIVPEIEPGVYVLTAKAENGPQYQDASATQWFVVSDIGLTTFSAEDGFHVFTRSIGSAEAKAGVELTLLAMNNRVLGGATTDVDGHARLPAGLLRGTGSDRPAVLTAKNDGGDFVFLDLTAAPFDLTDRGVGGRAPAGPLDVFLTADRGIYRAGETAWFTGLVRNSAGEAVEDLSLTAIATRPDGVEHKRWQVADQGAGGFVFDFDLPDNAMRGVWTVRLYTDPKRPALTQQTVIVEDFEPEKLDFDLTAQVDALDPTAPSPIDVEARYLFGAPAGNLEVAGEAVLTPTREVAGFTGYRFGLADDEPTATRQPLDGGTTDAEGKATVTLPAFEPPATTRPVRAAVNVRVMDASGRPVERTIDLPLAAQAARLGIKPRFDERVDEGSEAGFDLIAVDADGKRIGARVEWTLNKVTTRFQWYSTAGRWNYEPIRSSARVASGTVEIGADQPASLSLPVEWGDYELGLRDATGDAVPASLAFEAGWSVAATSLDTPEMAKVSLDKDRYRIGDTATVHIEPRFAGTADVLVMDERVIATKTAEIGAEGGDVSLPVTRDWGPGAYVTAVVYRPMDLDAKRMPGRAIGLAHASVDPGDRALLVAIDAPDKVEPRQTIEVSVAVDGVKAGETAYVTLAAVDVGILNITDFDPPSLSDHYFGQRQLGVEIRDLYSKLIDRMQGAPGTVRSGGDAGASYESPPPMDDLVALFSGLVTVGDDGRATIALDIPDFNGTLKLMALAWTKTGVGEANADLLVRDPLVISVSRPRFLAPGDASRIAIDVTHVEGPSGSAKLSLSGGDGFVSPGSDPAKSFEVAEGGRERLLFPVTAEAIGDAGFDVALEIEGGARLEKHFVLPVRSNAPVTVDKSRLELAANGGALTLDPDLFADFVPGTASATLSITGAADFDVAGVVRALDRYPYGCTEQITSRAMPLVYLDRTILAAGLGETADVDKRVEDAIAGVLANQSSNGSFGLWRPDYGDLWLDAYVTDFLTRAKEAGYAVPEEGLTLAVDNLRNSLSYLPDAPDWGPVAYAYYVLARNGRAAIGDLRYTADNQLPDFPTPLSKAQIGAALALYGDRLRAETVFRASMADDGRRLPNGALGDYGTLLRDEAAILTLALETGVDGVSFDRLVEQVNQRRREQSHTSTQEDAWSLLAAHALLASNPPKLTVAGQPHDGPFVESFDADGLAAGIDVENRGEAPIAAALTLRGVPQVAPPADTSGYSIERSMFTLEGEPVDPSVIGLGERLVAVVEMTPIDAGPARLMIDDPLPAGLEIDNPAILRGGDVAALDWLELSSEAAHTEFRADRFLAAVDQGEDDTATRRFAYIVRAVSPGSFVRPAASVENMYDPSRRGRTGEDQISVAGPLR
ncbi:MG2 domain-containing protein [Consotaella aegiceratis]|uniref:MG2 domain-containing protein n=1 Tax=Consotaella aegiceratis TaxID=3097961 RepID=UPI002F3E7AE9